MEFSHVSVLLQESIDALEIKPDGVYVDCTAGGGGHAAAVLQRLSPQGRMVLIDRDPDAVAVLHERFDGDSRVTIVRDNFVNIREILNGLSVRAIDGAVADLGVSSHQLDTPERGFSFHRDAPLDMRMSRTGRTAADLVNTATRQELAAILRRYGEEPYAAAIASAIVREREKQPITTTLQLANVISSSVPASYRRRGHPARRTFQALRIEVNAELESLREALPQLFDALNPGGVLAVITFHSLEDKIVKEYFQTLRQGCTCPPDFPVCVCGNKPKAVVKSRGVKAGEAELEENNRSRSAKLRVAKKL
ncbi:MAG: 16S rRNA (cytosine(1402)-N(4))-methyltransferase RsmH [Clostridia bacterium]|nr:16S rRNA (cytosine(1402)-N(4))-methyltransferase RsmH [Clostridia bacterium]